MGGGALFEEVWEGPAFLVRRKGILNFTFSLSYGCIFICKDLSFCQWVSFGNYKNATLQGKGQPKQFSNKQKLYRKSSLLLARTAYISMVSASRVPSSVVTKQCKLFLISLLQAATMRRPFNSLPAQ